ncbi:hypothetical protein HJFPF1_03242 [Paramyrothecium foliicola]|nr:hypothetical protein HJFPF1_03242 [Paramyrothecium foliicola]
METPKPQRGQRLSSLSRDTHPRHEIPSEGLETRNIWATWEYPPEFWDRLSKIDLTYRALKELDRRANTTRRHHTPPPPIASNRLDGRFMNPIPSPVPRELARFARQGGPDLRGLLGFPHPRVTGSFRRSLGGHATKSMEPPSTGTTPDTIRTKTKGLMTPYDRAFGQHLTDQGIHTYYSSGRLDTTTIKKALAERRPSLSASQVSGGAFETFQKMNAQANDEDDVLGDVVPSITGPKLDDHPLARNTLLGNLEPLTDGTLAAARPDQYYGATPGKLHPQVRRELAHHVIPSTTLAKPLAANFFLEVKGPHGSIAVATQQARYDGAIGTRAIHTLQNYGAEEPKFDGIYLELNVPQRKFDDICPPCHRANPRRAT